MVAQALQRRSARCGREMVTVDGEILQETLFESEIFGHERGAFTSADRQTKGLIEEAEGSTLFLDEIGETSPTIQVKLLRVLETNTFRRLGGTRTLRADVRFVVASNRELGEMSEAGSFRCDLYLSWRSSTAASWTARNFRLASFVIRVPLLRHGGNQAKAAVVLGISERNIYRLIKQHELGD